MSPEEKPLDMRLHFEGPSTSGHTLPSAALIQALQQFQRIIHLVAMADEGREVKSRARVTREIEQKFPLICHLPAEGGFAMPLAIGRTGDQLFDAEEINSIAQKTRRVIRAVDRGNMAALTEQLPDSYYRRGVVAAFSAMQPRTSSGLYVSIEDHNKQTLLDGKSVREKIEELSVKPVLQDAALAYIAGTLVEMKFSERRLRLSLANQKRSLEATYNEDFEPTLLQNPRERLQVHGNIMYDSDGLPMSISDVDDILEIDESPVEVSFVDMKTHVLRPKTPLRFQVTFDIEENIYEATGDFDIILGAETRPQLESYINDELAMLWREYALADDNSLTRAAQELKAKLRASFVEDTANAN